MKNLFILLFLLASNCCLAQDATKTVTLTVSGQGKTKDEATQNALRSAIEQAFGAFISSKTEILNDKLIKDEIVSVANGNIQKYDVISEVEIPSGGFATTLKAIVSVTKLASFCESKGVEVMFKGKILSANIQMIDLNKDNESHVVNDLCLVTKELLKKCFDYSINTAEPKFKHETYIDRERFKKIDTGYYNITLTVSTSLNENFAFLNEYIINTLNNIQMSESDIADYENLNLKYYELRILDLNKNKYTLYLRNEQNIIALKGLFGYPDSFLYNFTVSNDLGIITGSKFKPIERLGAVLYQIQKPLYKFFDFNVYANQGVPDIGGSLHYYMNEYSCASHPGQNYEYAENKERVNNRFPIVCVRQCDNHNKGAAKTTLYISMFCPSKDKVVAVREYDYLLDKEKMNKISKFIVEPVFK